MFRFSLPSSFPHQVSVTGEFGERDEATSLKVLASVGLPGTYIQV